MHKSRIGIDALRWMSIKPTSSSPSCERLQKPALAPASDVCQVEGCHAHAHPVYQEAGGPITGWLCDEHVASAGYCNHCRVYIADNPESRATWAFYGLCQDCTETLFH